MIFQSTVSASLSKVMVRFPVLTPITTSQSSEAPPSSVRSFAVEPTSAAVPPVFSAAPKMRNAAVSVPLSSRAIAKISKTVLSPLVRGIVAIRAAVPVESCAV